MTPPERAVLLDHCSSHVHPQVERLLDIADCARELRPLQSEYFRTRNKSVMIECKRLEAELDKLLASGGPRQEAMF